eukprot:3995682-Alexandrium_andersonii.AAC.1
MRILAPLLALLAAQPGLVQERDLDCVEYFAGVRSIQRGFIFLKMDAAFFDSTVGPCMDLLTKAGYLTALQYARRLKRGALAWMAPPCGSWVVISRGETVVTTCLSFSLPACVLAPYNRPPTVENAGVAS